MLFNSAIFIFVFLPIVLIGYFLLNKFKLIELAKGYLIFGSLVFYGYWNIKYVPIIIGSVIFNYAIGKFCKIIGEKSKLYSKIVLTIGVIANLLLLGYFKYCDFFIANFNFIFKAHIGFLNIALPLAISFFTFQQISYLVDSYKGQTKEYNFLNYALFVTFFPQLIAGPIVRHNEMLPQFAKIRTKVLNWKNFSEGLFLFTVGLFKKVVIADTVAKYADMGYSNYQYLSLLESWSTILNYTFQIYFDFSGYTDMALGIGKMFNIKLPQNFNNPYSATSMEDFWKKWHMTLSRFLKDYVYIPLGGNRTFLNVQTKFSSYINVLITFFISGLWHGASWMFVIWGMSHGVMVCVNKFLRVRSINISKTICWFMTFIYINLTWVFFRSENIETAKEILLSAFGFNGFLVPKIHHGEIWYGDNIVELLSLILPILLTVLIFLPISKYVKNNFRPNYIFFIITIILFMWSFSFFADSHVDSPFIYFNF